MRKPDIPTITLALGATVVLIILYHLTLGRKTK